MGVAVVGFGEDADEVAAAGGVGGEDVAHFLDFF